MADYKATDTEFTTVANAIRTRGGTSGQLEWPSGFASAIAAIPGGGSESPLKHIQVLGRSSSASILSTAASFGAITGKVLSSEKELLNPLIELTDQQVSDLLAILESGYDALLRYSVYVASSNFLGCDIHIYEAGLVSYTPRSNNFGFESRTCSGSVPIRYFGVNSPTSLAKCEFGTNENGIIVVRPNWDFSQLVTNSISSGNISNEIATALFLSSDFA